MSKIIINELSKSMGENYMFYTTIPTSTKFQQAEYLRKTILNYAPTTTGARAYRELAQEVESLIPVKEQTDGKS